MKKNSIPSLAYQENLQLTKLHSIVQDAMKEEALIINNLLHPPEEVISRGQAISDLVARFGGSWYFIIIFMGLLCVWIIFNILAIGQFKFDPYPFILLNLILSSIAALQAPIIMMSQNRQEEKDRKRSENDYLINLKAEIEIRGLHQKIDLLLEEQIVTLYETQASQLVLLQEINQKLEQLGKRQNQ